MDLKIFNFQATTFSHTFKNYYSHVILDDSSPANYSFSREESWVVMQNQYIRKVTISPFYTIEQNINELSGEKFSVRFSISSWKLLDCQHFVESRVRKNEELHHSVKKVTLILEWKTSLKDRRSIYHGTMTSWVVRIALRPGKTLLKYEKQMFAVWINFCDRLWFSVDKGNGKYRKSILSPLHEILTLSGIIADYIKTEQMALKLLRSEFVCV